MRFVWCIALALAAGLLADDAGDRAAIERVVAGLNRETGRAALFAADPDSQADLRRLERIGLGTFEDADQPMSEVTRPKITVGPVRMITHDVAMVDAAQVQYGSMILKRNLSLLIILKREGGDWKIATLRVTPMR